MCFSDDVEHELQFIGLLIMENRLKHETTAVIRLLHKADIRPVMVTGMDIFYINYLISFQFSLLL